PDLRNSRVIDVIERLKTLGHDVTVHDPLADAGEAAHEYGVELVSGPPEEHYDLVLVAVPHAEYAALTDDQLTALVGDGGLLADLKNLFRERRFVPPVDRWTL